MTAHRLRIVEARFSYVPHDIRAAHSGASLHQFARSAPVPPPGPDPASRPRRVDAQVGCHGGCTAVQRPVRERLVTVEPFRRYGQPMVLQPPAFDRQRLSERGPRLAATVPAGDRACFGDQPGIAVVLRAEEVGLRLPVQPAEPSHLVGDLLAVRVAAGPRNCPAVDLGRDKHMREASRRSGPP